MQGSKIFLGVVQQFWYEGREYRGWEKKKRAEEKRSVRKEDGIMHFSSVSADIIKLV